MQSLESYIKIIPDFPKPGIKYRDVLPLFDHAMDELLTEFSAQFSAKMLANVTHIAGIEARGFILGAALATKLQKGFIPIRKKGKLPPPVLQQHYQLEYGTDTLEMKQGSGRVLLVDDVLATGGTLAAAQKLCNQAGYSIAGIGCIINLAALNSFTVAQIPVKHLFTYHA